MARLPEELQLEILGHRLCHAIVDAVTNQIKYKELPLDCSYSHDVQKVVAAALTDTIVQFIDSDLFSATKAERNTLYRQVTRLIELSLKEAGHDATECE